MTKTNKYISSAIMIAIGILLIILRGGIMDILLTALGVALIVMGIMDVVQKKDVTACVIKCVIGAVIILGGLLFLTVMLYILGGLLVVTGVLWIVKLVQRKTKGNNLLETVTAYLVPALYILVGICLFLNQTGFMNVIFVIIGIIVLVNGIIQLVGAIKEGNSSK